MNIKINPKKEIEISESLVCIDESLREISALQELYLDITKSQISNKKEASIKHEEAKFARERLLKLSLHIHHLVNTIDKNR